MTRRKKRQSGGIAINAVLRNTFDQELTLAEQSAATYAVQQNVEANPVVSASDFN